MDTATPSLYKRRMLECDAEYLSANGMHLTSEALGAWTTAMAMAPMTWHTVAWLQVLTEAIKADLQALTPGTTSVRGPASGHRESHQACAGVHARCT